MYFTTDYADRGGDLAHVWLHPADSGLRAILCRHDPFPGWSESLWLLDLCNAAAPDVAVEVPLHGTGVASFAWLACPGELLAHVVDRTHMGTITDQVFRLGEGGRVFVYRVEARKSAKWCAGLVRMCRYVQYGSRGRQTGRFEGARARG